MYTYIQGHTECRLIINSTECRLIINSKGVMLPGHQEYVNLMAAWALVRTVGPLDLIPREPNLA